MKYILILLLLASCSEASTPMFEVGVVVAKENKDAPVQIVMDSTNVLRYSDVPYHMDKYYSVVFKCSHGMLFVVDNPDIYYKVNENDSVILCFQEVYNDEGDVVNYKFLDANILTDEQRLLQISNTH